MNKIDVTSEVKFGRPDDECLPIHRCVCGSLFPDWDYVIDMDSDTDIVCPACGRKLYFENKITVWEIREGL